MGIFQEHGGTHGSRAVAESYILIYRLKQTDRDRQTIDREKIDREGSSYLLLQA